MIPASRQTRPLQRRCSACRRIQEVRLSRLYHLVVPNKGGGTRRDGGYDCRYCGFENVVAAPEMPAGLLLTLPSRAAYQEALARSKQATSEAAPSPPQRRSTAPATPPRTIDANPPRPASPSSPAPTPSSTPPSPPVWLVGHGAKDALLRAHSRSELDRDGHCTAFLRSTGGRVVAVDKRGAIETSNILDWLDAVSCELLVIGGTASTGDLWKMIFHPLAGAASLAEEPA